MGAEDWYRSTSWDAKIEAAFFKKLSRARYKSQYLRIQAAYLTKACPVISLSLLEEFFKLPIEDDAIAAHDLRAAAHLQLGEIDKAIASFRTSLALEGTPGNIGRNSSGHLDLPLLIATHRLKELYPEAMTILDTCRGKHIFPASRYRWHAAQALIMADSGYLVEAREAADKAFAEAAIYETGLRFHPHIGLVDERRDNLKTALEMIARTVN